VRANDGSPAGFQHALERWEERPDAEIVGYPTVVDRHIKVGAQQYAPTGNV
jgi:hypothetical protein